MEEEEEEEEKKISQEGHDMIIRLDVTQGAFFY